MLIVWLSPAYHAALIHIFLSKSLSLTYDIHIFCVRLSEFSGDIFQNNIFVANITCKQIAIQGQLQVVECLASIMVIRLFSAININHIGLCQIGNILSRFMKATVMLADFQPSWTECCGIDVLNDKGD